MLMGAAAVTLSICPAPALARPKPQPVEAPPPPPPPEPAAPVGLPARILSDAAAYQAYLVLLGSGTVQLAVKVAHEYLNKYSLVVAAGPRGSRFRLNGDHTLLAGPAGAMRAAEAAASSRRAIAELLRDGETAVDSWAIFDSFPDHVLQDGRLVSLPAWHRTGLRELCYELFAQPSTRAARSVMSAAFSRLGQPTEDAR